MLFSFCCPCRQGWGGHGYWHLFFIFSFPSLFFSHCVLYHQSPTLLSFAIFPNSPPTLQISVSLSPPITFLVFLASFFLQFFGHLVSLTTSSSILSTCPAHFSLLLTFFLRSLSLHPPLSVSLECINQILLVRMLDSSLSASICQSWWFIIGRFWPFFLPC